ncbi:hypothetical protein SCUP234_12690 [Seiridium cupressi]
MGSTGSSHEFRLSDLEVTIISLQTQHQLVGYRNLLSYVSALGVRVFPEDAFDVSSWEHLGSGSYSTTYRADFLTSPGKVFAVKQPNASFTRENKAVEGSLQHSSLTSIIQELRTLANAKLRDHPNLPRVLGVFFREEQQPAGIRPGVVFELALSDLQQYMVAKETDALRSAELTKFAFDIAHGLAALHACGLTHGDLKPDNILLYLRDGETTATVADLGTCGVSSNASPIIKGSRWYCAPEYLNGSEFSSDVNKQSRDVYNYGLILWSIMTRCREKPFPGEDQFDIQHKAGAASYLLKGVTPGNKIPMFLDAMEKCLMADPKQRPLILEVLFSANPEAEMSDLRALVNMVEEDLLDDPANPRVKALSQLPLPTHLIAKLRLEYANPSDAHQAIRSAITLAGLYSGAVGAPIEGPWKTVAKIQWLLKAIELGSHPAVTAIMLDSDAVGVLEEFGTCILRLSHRSFESPTVGQATLFHVLQDFALMPDEDSANILVWLGGPLDFHRFERRRQKKDTPPGYASDGVSDGASDDASEADGLRQFHRFTANRKADLDMVDSDAYDLSMVEKSSPIERSVFDNSLEEFMILARDETLQFKETTRLMAAAIFHGSMDIVRYLCSEYKVLPNDTWEDMSHLDHAILFLRPLIVEYFLAQGGQIVEAKGSLLSGLHLANRHDDPSLVGSLCDHLKKEGRLTSVLESFPVEGKCEGWTVAFTAMACGSWKTLEVLLDQGADPNCPTPDGLSLITLATIPSSPATPISILDLLLQNGASLGDEDVYDGSAFKYAVGSSNVRAVYQFLRHGALVSDAAVRDAQENIEEAPATIDAPIYDEDHNVVPNAWEDLYNASTVVCELLSIGRHKNGAWQQELDTALSKMDPGGLGKLWIVNFKPELHFIQVEVPQ